MTKFIGRRKEFEALEGLLGKDSASLVVIRGRRRIGKSRLAEEFSHQFPQAITLSGIPPEEGVTASDQRAEFLRQLQEYKIPIYKSDDWGDLFYELAQATSNGRFLITLDEITWMGSKDPTFLPKLKTAWDRHFIKNPKLVMILSGSHSAWIYKNILSSTGFFGRVSLRLHLEELSLAECNAFWDNKPGVTSSYDKFKILSVTGGIPRYLEEIRPDLSAEQNLQRLCFNKEGLLFNEFDQIFHDLFLKKGPFYKKMIAEIINQNISATELASRMKTEVDGDLSDALLELVETGFLARDYTWNLATKKPSSISQYRVKDNYLRFYLKYIQPYREQIITGEFDRLPLGWFSILGLQFENLVLNNGASLRNLLNIRPDDLVYAGPYLQTERSRRQGCQVDYLIQSRFNILYICETKFKQSKIGIEIIDEIKNKISLLQIPKNFSYQPVLIHVNGVEDSVIDSGFFAHIIDFSQLLGM